MPERRTIDDLDRAVRAMAQHFNDDAVVVIGSQAALVGWPTTPDEMRNTPEIDLYVAHVRQWELQNVGDFDYSDEMLGEIAHDEVSGFFGEGTQFHQTFGFFIDGVSPRTAALPTGWETRAVFREVKNGDATIVAIAPCLEDLAVSKIRRLAEKDRNWIEACIAARGLDLEKVADGIRNAPGFDDHQRRHALTYVASLTSRKPFRADPPVAAPHYPNDGKHIATWTADGFNVLIRELDPSTGIYYKISNPIGPAGILQGAEFYALHGIKMSRKTWEEHPEVQAVRPSEPEPEHSGPRFR